jgi:N-ethylmaleimide reductase
MSTNVLPNLFAPLSVGDIEVANRIVMAPLTRSRADMGGVPSPLAVEYYRQRASAGLIISEATNISREGRGYAFTPGIYTHAHIAAWRRITDAVHEAGGKIVCQLWHVGRMSQTDEIARILADYRHAARCAREAGFDGVEIHAANCYLLEQFIRDSTNQRTDQYGGPVKNRTRLPIEVVTAVAGIWGAGRVGVRLSPITRAVGDTPLDSDPQATYFYLAEQLGKLGLAYLHCVEGQTRGDNGAGDFDFMRLHAKFGGRYIANNSYDRDMAMEAVAEGHADMIAFGRPFIANPDLVERLRRSAPLAQADHATFYGGGAAGYTDYPALA